jgi:hypothetical protein
MIATHLSLDYGPCQEHLVTWDKVVGTLTHISKRLAASNQQERNIGVRSREAAPLEQGGRPAASSLQGFNWSRQYQPFNSSRQRLRVRRNIPSACFSRMDCHRSSNGRASPDRTAVVWRQHGILVPRRRTVGMAREAWGRLCRLWTT